MLAASSKTLSTEIARHHRKDARARRTRERAQTLGIRSAQVIWIMFSLAADPSGAVLQFLRGSNLKRRYVGATDSSLLELAERSFLEADLEEVASLATGNCPVSAHALSLARRYLAEWELFQWCARLNESVGAAPSTVALLRRARRHPDVFPAAAFQLTRSGRPALAARKWVERWRKRWGARMGTLRLREKYSMQEMKTKVCVFSFVCM